MNGIGNRPRIVVLCCDGIYQRYFVQRLHQAYQVVGIVVRKEPQAKGSLAGRLRRYLNPVALARYLLARFDMARSARVSAGLVESLYYEQGRPPAMPAGVECITVPDINSPEAVAFVERHAPDMVCVNGTNLLRAPMLGLADQIPLGIVNLHTGLSPYTRGGNCNLFALLEGKPEWVGVTVHHIDPGIDSGDLILTRQVEMQADDEYDHIDARTFRLGADLMVLAVKQIAEGRAARVPQWDEGKLYLRRTGYVYEPYHWYRANRLLRKGLIKRYLQEKKVRDAAVRLVGETS